MTLASVTNAVSRKLPVESTRGRLEKERAEAAEPRPAPGGAFLISRNLDGPAVRAGQAGRKNENKKQGGPRGPSLLARPA